MLLDRLKHSEAMNGTAQNHRTGIIHKISHQYNRDFEAFQLQLNLASLGVSQQPYGPEINFKIKKHRLNPEARLE